MGSTPPRGTEEVVNMLTLGLFKIECNWSKRAGPYLLVKYKNKRLKLFLICHRKKERCIQICGHTSFLCARCTGLYMGAIVSLFLSLIGLVLSPYLGLVLVLPMLLDGFSQLLGFRESNNVTRLLTGLLFSMGFISFLMI